MRTSITDEADYRDLCAQAARDPDTFATFRADPVMIRTLEHVDPSHGVAYLRTARDGLPGVDLAALIGSELGSPQTFDFGGGINCAPTTLRYLKVMVDLERLFGDLTGKSILEIGGGYGGQARIIARRFELDAYRIVDLPEPQRLAAAFLSHFDLGCRLFVGAPTVGGHDLVISNYAFSELSRGTQESYRPLVETAERGYMTCNFTSDGYGIDSMSRDELAGLHPGAGWIAEDPLTWPGNEILVW